jgi:hypothetical protein
MNYSIKVGDYTLKVVDSITIVKSVENLADTAVIVIPGTHINRALNIEDKVKEGDVVEIQLGYNDDLKMEFTGYLNSISTDDAAIRLECEDALYLFKKPVADKEYSTITLKALLNEVIKQVGGELKISCDYEFTWEKFVFFKATAFDVLKKVQDETKANIYFKGDTLHVHPQYSEIFNEKTILYDFARNIEKSNLKYVLSKNKKISIEVTATLPDGKTKKITYGNTGGEKRTVALGTADEASMKNRAIQEYNIFAYDGYEGNFTGWLVPFVEPGYKVHLRDSNYSYKDGDYYVVSVETKFSSAGGARTITLGKRIG